MPGELLAQTLLGQYRLDTFLASLPGGDFYRAIDIKHNKYKGITILPARQSQEVDELKKIERRAPFLAKLTHPNLVAFRGLQQTPQTSFLLEDWVEGPSLRDVLLSRPGQPLPLLEGLVFAKAASAALDALHAQRFSHYGLCPEQIRIDRKGNIHLASVGSSLSFGESVETSAAQTVYAAPEQSLPAPAHPAGDIYALGVILYEALGGILLDENSDLGQPLKKLNPALPDFVSRVLPRALAKKPAERFSTASELFLTLCLACGLQADEVPDRIAPEPCPITHSLLAAWHYASPLETPSLISIEETLKQPASAKKPERGLWFWLRPALGLALLGGIAFSIWSIQPPQPVFAPPPQATIPPAIPITAAPTLTLPPPPTKAKGGRIIFTCTRGDYNQLCLINADGSDYRQITSGNAHHYYPKFAPQGGMFVFASNQFGSFDIFLTLMSNGDMYQLTKGIGNVISPDFSPDGQKIVFANRAAEGPTSLWVVDSAGINPRLVYAGPNTIVATAWSPDGLTIAFAMSVGQPNEFEIFLLNTEGTNARQISSGLLGVGGSLDWSPDGKTLLIYAGPPGDKDIFTLDIAAGNWRQLTDGGNNAASAYSPDGQFIVFNSLRNDDQADLFIMRADGSELRQLTDNPEPDWQPHWEP